MGVSFDVNELVDTCRSLVDHEGVVIRFDSGHMVKVKGDWYLNLHRAKDNILYERHVIEMILNQGTDDLKPVLHDNLKAKLIEYETRFGEFYNDVITSLCWHVNLLTVRHQATRKEFAISVIANYKVWSPAVLKKYEELSAAKTGDEVRELVVEGVNTLLYKVCNSNSSLREFKIASGATFEWNP